jgi:hypothetical protein
MCHHQPQCPAAEAADHAAARVVARHADQGWSLLCNGVVLFDDTGELMPNRQVIPPQRTCAPHTSRRSLAASATA